MKVKHFIEGVVGTHKMICYALGIAVLIGCMGSCALRIQRIAVKAAVQNTEELSVLRIGSAVFAPYFYVDEDGGYAGVDVDLAKEACERMGYTPTFTELVWGEHDTVLNAGMIDCVWCSFSMNGREEMYQWAGPYLYSPEVVVVSENSNIKSLEDLDGKTVAVEVDSKPEEYFLKTDEGVNLNVRNVQTYSNLEDAFTSFGKGYADAVAGHKMALNYFTSERPELYRYLEPSIINAKLGVAFRKEDDSGVVTLLSETLDEMNEDGTISDIISKYGFSDDMLVSQQKTDGGSE